DRQFGADRDRVQSPRPGQADRWRPQSARLHDAAGHDGHLHVDRRAGEPGDRPCLCVRRSQGQTAMTASAPRPALRSPARDLLGSVLHAFNTNKTSWVGFVIFALIALAALLAPLLAPHDPIEQDVMAKLRPPTSDHLLGTDSFGRDILSRLLYG